MNELYHYGVLGMKWGVRRYQNADGSLTAAGKRRYGSSESLYALPPSEKERKEREKAREKERKILKESGKNIESAFKNAANITSITRTVRKQLKTEKEAQTNAEKLAKQKAKYTKDLENMSDQELREVVNRMQLENTYKSMMSQKNAPTVSKGKDTVDAVLDYAGTALTTASSVVGLALSIQTLMKLKS